MMLGASADPAPREGQGGQAPNPGAVVGLEPKQVLGCSKSGLRVSLHDLGGQIVLRGRADPLLLYLTIGAALGLGLLASVVYSPAQGVVGSFVFSALFSPVLLFLIYSTFRLRTRCVISKSQGSVFINERSYRSRTSLTIPLAELSGIVIRARSQLPIVGGPETYSLYLETPKLRYLVLVSYDEAGAQHLAERLSTALELPVTLVGFEDPAEGVRLPLRLLAGTAGLYLAPTLAAVVVLSIALHDVRVEQRLMITSLGAVLLSQVGAILAFAYYRGNEPRE